MKNVDTEVSSKLMPSHLVSSIRNITLSDRNVQERFVFWQDALKIVRDHPVFGLGGGAFEETYRRYQSYYYSSTQTHNHYVQMWAEVGTVGLFIFLLYGHAINGRCTNFICAKRTGKPNF